MNFSYSVFYTDIINHTKLYSIKVNKYFVRLKIIDRACFSIFYPLLRLKIPILKDFFDFLNVSTMELTLEINTFYMLIDLLYKLKNWQTNQQKFQKVNTQ